MLIFCTKILNNLALVVKAEKQLFDWVQYDWILGLASATPDPVVPLQSFDIPNTFLARVGFDPSLRIFCFFVTRFLSHFLATSCFCLLALM